jgi:putative transposase
LPADPQDLVIMDRIDAIYTDMPYHGVRRMTKQLRRDGFAVGKKLVRRLMREMGLEPIYPKPNLSKNHTQSPRYPYLLKGLIIDRPNQVWGTDITYIKMRQGFVYLVAFLDWYSRYVVSWRISTSLDTKFVIEAATQPETMTPEITNSEPRSPVY